MSEPSATAASPGPWIAHLRREAERFAEVVTRSPQQVHVPAYPVYTVHSRRTQALPRHRLHSRPAHLARALSHLYMNLGSRQGRGRHIPGLYRPILA